MPVMLPSTKESTILIIIIPFQNQTFYHAKKRKMCSDKIDTEEMVKIMFHYLRLLLCLEGKNSSFFGKSEILQKNVILFVYCSECKTNLIIIFNGLCVLVISNQIHFMKHTLLQNYCILLDENSQHMVITENKNQIF